MRLERVYSLIIAGNIIVAGILGANFFQEYTAAAENQSAPNQKAFIQPAYDSGLLQATADQINQTRAKNGLQQLSQSRELDAIAQKRATDMASNGYYSHTGSDGRYFDDLLKEQGIGYQFACENLNIHDQPSSKTYVTSWLESKDHRDCMLHDSIKSAGYAAVKLEKLNGIPTTQEIIVAIYVK